MKTLGMILLLLSLSLSGAVVYKKVNQDGSITYSDLPSEGAVEFDLSGSNSAIMESSVTSKAKPTKTLKTAKKIQVPYQLKLISPNPEQTIRSNLGEMNIVASITPEAPGQYQLILNGEVQASQASGTFQLEGLDRGEYAVLVRFIDNSGKVLASSDQQTFYLHKASALIKANQ